MSDRSFRRFGIGERLGLAFSLSAVLAILACAVGWYSYARLTGAIQQVGQKDLPATVSAGQFAQLGGAIIAAAPLLAQAPNASQLQDVDAQLAERLSAMRGILKASQAPSARNVWVLVDDLEENLRLISRQALAGLELKKQNDAMLGEVRAIHGDLVEEAEPLIEDARFNINVLLDDLDKKANEGRDSIAQIKKNMNKAEAILQVSSHANLAIGLIGRIASAENHEKLINDEYFLSEAIELIRDRLKSFEQSSDTITYQQILRRLMELAIGDDSFLKLRKRELENQALIAGLLKANRTFVVQMDGEIDSILKASLDRATVSSENAFDLIQLGERLLLFIAFVAVAASLFIGIHYVRGNIIRRIGYLADVARSLARGSIPAPIEISGADELSDMARAMEGFRKTQNELVQTAKLAALGHLSAGIAHELNQPLNAIRSQTHNAVILQERGDAAALSRALAKISNLTERASQTVNHLRRFARRSDRSLYRVAVEPVIRSAIVLLASRIKDVGADVTVSIPADLAAEAEEIRLEQVIVNLLSNALDATADQRGARVEVSAEASNNLVRISVRDNGAGIEPAVAQTMFDPFVTTKPVGVGMGLGLAISYNIIRDFGGVLKAVPSDKGGAHFVVELRAAAEELAP